MITTQTLKNAARAIECDLWTDPSGSNYLAKDGAILRRWEPEHSSADSFELMVSIGVCAQVRGNVGYAQSPRLARVLRFPERGSNFKCESPSLALRTVILMAASEIGAAL